MVYDIDNYLVFDSNCFFLITLFNYNNEDNQKNNTLASGAEQYIEQNVA